MRRACRELELGEVRAYRWLARRAIGELADRPPGGSPMHGLLDEEVAEILALFDEWGETDRSHRKLARAYPKGTKISDEQMASLPLTRHDFHGEWNYTLQPE